MLAAPLQRVVGYGLRIVPPGSLRDWGPAAHPTVAVHLTGQAEIEASNGDIRRLTPGTVLVADDTTGRGHRARVVGNEPVTAMHIVLPDDE